MILYLTSGRGKIVPVGAGGDRGSVRAMPSRLIYYTRVKRIERQSRLVRAWKDADGEVHTVHEDLGWFVQYEGSRESMHVGDIRPAFEEGDAIKVTIEVCNETNKSQRKAEGQGQER